MMRARIAFAFAALARTASILAQGARIGAVLAHVALALPSRTYPPDNSARRTPQQARKRRRPLQTGALVRHINHQRGEENLGAQPPAEQTGAYANAWPPSQPQRGVTVSP